MDGKGRNREGRREGRVPLTEGQGKMGYRGVERRGIGEGFSEPPILDRSTPLTMLGLRCYSDA